MTSTITAKSSTDEIDPTLIGTHCQLEYCNRLDFLPFHCESCRHTFCLDHRSETAHKCSKAGEWAARRREENLKTQSLGIKKNMQDVERCCASSICKTIIGTSLSISVHCASCNQYYCLKHRLKDEHDCSNQKVSTSRATAYSSIFGNQTEQAKTAFSKLKAWGSAQKANVNRSLPKQRVSPTAARMIVINNLKKTAKGDDKLPSEKRVYLHVEAESATTCSKLPSGAFFYSTDWVIGRVLDAAAKALQVQNVNNEGDKEKMKLRVFHIEKGRILDFSEKVGSVLTNGDTIVLLRGVGPSVIDLIDLTST
ncbi:AN1-type zinc finger protein 1 [Erysiphe neolycopersici]|uniref:AN1-type zinc finger protein 1 n=1 Tax=Erysiphe neolycopersici TaxID=212602 RepID=A0A420HUJ7_9PEZI|nr:AN1-type zinc finger protein 1 [Erysiphe neolycopersici]